MAQVLDVTEIWLTLVGGVVLYALAARRIGKWALPIVFGFVWAGLAVGQYFTARLEYGSLPDLFWHLEPGTSIGIVVTILPLLLSRRTAPLRRTLVWGVGAATFAAFLIGQWFEMNTPRRSPCVLPSLEASIPFRTIDEVSTRGFFDDTCPVPMATELEFSRPYGSLRMHWWGSPHRLYMVGNALDGSSLTIRGARVEEFENSAEGAARFDVFTHRVTFPNSEWDPIRETFSVEIVGEDGESLDQLELEYVPRQCTCAYGDSL